MAKPHLPLVRVKERPLAKLFQAEKIASAIGYLRSRGLYVLDKGTPAKWGDPTKLPKSLPPVIQHGRPGFFKSIGDRFATAWKGK